MKHILSVLCEQPWAITRQGMETLHAILERRTDIDAVAAKYGKPLENTGGRVEMRGSVAVLEITGPLFRYANLFTEVSGATSVEMLGVSFNKALESPQVEAILFNVNSPGGQADGIGELAAMIHDARKRKPIAAYVGGFGASGGYWLAAAAETLTMHETAFVGSIGCVASVVDSSQMDAKVGIRRYDIVSSQSPKKRLDVSTEEGRGEIQQMVDACADVFVARVAAYRGATVEHVLAEYGKGLCLPAARALKAGMVDGIGSFESVIAQMSAEHDRGSGIAIAAGAPVVEGEDNVMADDTALAQARVEAVKADRARIQAILACEEAKGQQGLAQHLALGTDMDVETARVALAKVEKPAAAAPAEPKQDQFTEHMRKVANPEVGHGDPAGGNDDEAEVRAVLQYIPAANRRAS